MENRIVCRVLTGPTASGKSELAFRIAREYGWEIICMDSMQVYRGMDIGTAKPTPEERTAVIHHLLDICDPREAFSVSSYVEEAVQTVQKCASRGKTVLFVGGTGLYLESMMRGMSLGNIPADEQLRSELKALAAGPDGKRLLDERLRETDPDTADKLPLNDLRRRIRAIEVSEKTGIPFSKQSCCASGSPFRWIVAGTCMERDHLYGKINLRAEHMIKRGLAGEVERLISEGVPEDAQSMQAIGYKEMIPYIRGEYTKEKALYEICIRTRHYAKRQITYLKRIEETQFVNTESEDAYEHLTKIFSEGGDLQK